MSPLTTHVLDTMHGRPAAGITVIVYYQEKELARGITDANGRITNWLEGKALAAGIYKLVFETGAYFETSFYPVVEISVQITGDAHYHIPLLLSPFGYSTYRGS